MSYLVNLSEHDFELVVDALSYYSMQRIFGERAELAAQLEIDLEKLKIRQDES